MTIKIKSAAVSPAEITKQPKGARAMGEVRVRAKLINAGDEALVRRGLMEPGKMRTSVVDALVDTGSVRTVLPVEVAQQLGLAMIAKTEAEYANGSKEIVDLTEAVIVEINGRRAAKETLVLGDEVLIGQTILEEMDLLVDCFNQRVIGNPAHPDQPVFKVK